eukprot:TRINITY_DN4540_c0_g1_i1.p1 TRINITY_DN4540_c0_g1~~TRINITY_DN4540_c0_g1_i1.p1  ORF type:complete len:871 (-),score=166.23 TRINITY_DN4540_c0_g1_i1:15-2627(-)
MEEKGGKQSSVLRLLVTLPNLSEATLSLSTKCTVDKAKSEIFSLIPDLALCRKEDFDLAVKNDRLCVEFVKLTQSHPALRKAFLQKEKLHVFVLPRRGVEAKLSSRKNSGTFDNERNTEKSDTRTSLTEKISRKSKTSRIIPPDSQRVSPSRKQQPLSPRLRAETHRSPPVEAVPSPMFSGIGVSLGALSSNSVGQVSSSPRLNRSSQSGSPRSLITSPRRGKSHKSSTSKREMQSPIEDRVTDSPSLIQREREKKARETQPRKERERAETQTKANQERMQKRRTMEVADESMEKRKGFKKSASEPQFSTPSHLHFSENKSKTSERVIPSTPDVKEKDETKPRSSSRSREKLKTGESRGKIPKDSHRHSPSLSLNSEVLHTPEDKEISTESLPSSYHLNIDIKFTPQINNKLKENALKSEIRSPSPRKGSRPITTLIITTAKSIFQNSSTADVTRPVRSSSQASISKHGGIRSSSDSSLTDSISPQIRSASLHQVYESSSVILKNAPTSSIRSTPNHWIEMCNQNLTIEDVALQQNITCTDNDVPWYSSFFFNKDHTNYVGYDPINGPICISVLLDEENASFIVRTSHGIQFKKSTISAIKRPYLQMGKGKTKELVSLVCPSIPKKILQKIKDPKIQKSLIHFEQTMIFKEYKVGVLYCKAGQTTEEEMLSNQQSDVSPAFEEFVDVLGERIELQGWKKFRGGLDVKTGLTGERSVYTSFRGLEIMFHVSPFLPFSSLDPQHIEKKRHLGNDIVVVIFKEGNALFSPDAITSQYNHVFIVVEPVEGPEKQYRVGVTCKHGVNVFPPYLPEQPVFLKNENFRDFLLCKIINGERAALHAPVFSQKMKRTNHQLLHELKNTFCPQFNQKKYV